MLSYQTGRSWLKLVVLSQLWGLIQRLPILQFAPRLLKHQGNNKELVMHNLRLHIHITPLSQALLLILHSDPSPPLSCCRLSEISTKAWGGRFGPPSTCSEGARTGWWSSSTGNERFVFPFCCFSNTLFFLCRKFWFKLFQERFGL